MEHEDRRVSTLAINSALPPKVVQFLHAAQTNEHSSIRSLLNEESLLLWFYVRPELLAEILDTVVQHNPGPLDACTVIQAFLTPNSAHAQRITSLTSTDVGTRRALPAFYPLADAFASRLRGQVAEAYEILNQAFPKEPPLHHFRDPANAWPQFLAVQKGITATLAGRLFEALGHFHSATLRTSAPHFEFLSRDALVKSALIHATFGDPHEAYALLKRAQLVPRSDSWAEQGIDASAQIATSMLQEDAAAMAHKLAAIDTSQVGEMWPFYVHAHYRACETANSNSLALQKVSHLRSLPFPTTDGEGYPGSVFHLAEASLSIAAGAPLDARRQLNKADQSFILTRILNILLELQVGANSKVTQLASSIRNETLPFRRMELWRISMLAQALLGAGREKEAAQVLGQLRALPRPLSRAEAAYFSVSARSVSAELLGIWPDETTVEGSYLDSLPSSSVHLSAREYEILLLLTSGRPNKELAAELFISVNTLKSQLRAIYRKLDAGSREEALRNAASRGLL